MVASEPTLIGLYTSYPQIYLPFLRLACPCPTENGDPVIRLQHIMTQMCRISELRTLGGMLVPSCRMRIHRPPLPHYRPPPRRYRALGAENGPLDRFLPG